MVIGLAEFMNKLSAIKSKQERVEALRYNTSKELFTILLLCYDPSIIFDIPEGIPPYTPNPLLDQEWVLRKETTKDQGGLKYFIKGLYPEVSQLKKESIFIQLLERVAPQDAIMLCNIKDKKPFKGITLEMVMEAFPGLIKLNNEEDT